MENSTECGGSGEAWQNSQEGSSRGLVVLSILQDEAPESLQTKLSSLRKHQSRLGRLLTVGIPRPS